MSDISFILVITPEYPPHNIGGGGIVVQKIAKELVKRGYKVVVLAGYYQTKTPLDKPWVDKDGKIMIIWLPLLPTPRNAPYLETYMPPNIYALLELCKILKEYKPDIVHLHGYGHLLVDCAALTLRLRNRPYVLTIHGIPESPLRRGISIIKVLYFVYTKTLGLLTLRGAKKVTAVSKSFAFESLNYGANPRKLVVIYNGIDENYAQGTPYGAFRKNYKISDSTKIILSIGRLTERKGFQYVIQALPYIIEEFNDVIYVIIGDGPFRQMLVQLTKKLNLNKKVLFTGFIPEFLKKQALNDADIVVIPSLRDPMPITALEALSFGKPIVASAVDGLKELLTHEVTALLVPPANPRAIAKAILRLLNDSELMRKLRRNSSRLIRKYRWDKITNMYIALYKMTLSNNHA